MKVEQTTLKNGLKTLFVDLKGSGAASAQMWFRAGSALEKDSDLGIAHFLEHMFFKGTTDRPGAQMAFEVESYGGEINAFTSFDYTCYYINTPNKELSKTVDILMDMVSNPLFSEDELAMEREVVFEEYKRSIDNPNNYNFLKLQKTCFKGGYKTPILGTEETIKNFSREQVVNFREKFYNRENSILVIAGDLKDNRDEIVKLIENYSLVEGEKSHFPEFILEKRSKIEVHHKDVHQVLLTMCIQAPEFLNEMAASEDLAINCLGCGETSRIYKKLVTETTLASSVSASTMFFAQGGAHFIRIACPFENLEKILDILTKELQLIVKKGFSEEEVYKIKNQYVASKVYEKESIESYSFALGYNYVQNQNIHSEDEFIDRIKKTSVSVVNDSINSILSKRINISTQIPNKCKATVAKKIIKDFKIKLESIKMPIKKDKQQVCIKSKHDPEVKLFEIKKGVKLIYRHSAMTPTFVFQAYLRGGLSYETKKNNGIYSLISQLLGKGYKGISYNKLRLDIENKSAQLGGFAGKNAYGLMLHGQSDHTDELLKHFFGCLLTPSMSSSFIKHEKELIYRSFENQEKDPVKLCFKRYNELIFGTHPYSMTSIGTKKSISKVTQKILSAIHQRDLKKEEIVITYCGDLDSRVVMDKLKPYLSKLPSRKEGPPKLKSVSVRTGKHEKITLEREQSHIMIGLTGFKMGDKKNLYLKMLTAFLSGQSSELFLTVRDRLGLCYAVQPVHFNGLEGGHWGIYIATGNDRVDKAVEAIKKIIFNLRDNGFTEEELERIKVMIEGQSVMGVQTNEDYANIYSIPVLQNASLDYYYKNRSRLQNIKLEEINSFLKSYFSKEFTSVTVGV